MALDNSTQTIYPNSSVDKPKETITYEFIRDLDIDNNAIITKYVKKAIYDSILQSYIAGVIINGGDENKSDVLGELAFRQERPEAYLGYIMNNVLDNSYSMLTLPMDNYKFSDANYAEYPLTFGGTRSDIAKYIQQSIRIHPKGCGIRVVDITNNAIYLLELNNELTGDMVSGLDYLRYQ